MDEKKTFAQDTESRFLKAKSDALRLLSFKPRSVEELRGRLRLKKYGSEVIENVIESLKRQGILNDEKFAKLFANSRVYTRPAGRRQLEFDLKRKGLSKELVATTLGDLKDVDEKKMARDLVFTRFQKMSDVPEKKRKARLFGFLRRRGFQNDTIFAVMRELFRDTDEES